MSIGNENYIQATRTKSPLSAWPCDTEKRREGGKNGGTGRAHEGEGGGEGGEGEGEGNQRERERDRMEQERGRRSDALPCGTATCFCGYSDVLLW
jgi:hypothetical protein